MRLPASLLGSGVVAVSQREYDALNLFDGFDKKWVGIKCSLARSNRPILQSAVSNPGQQTAKLRIATQIAQRVREREEKKVKFGVMKEVHKEN